MVAPYPELDRKLRNTDNIIKTKRTELAAELHAKYPEDYINVDSHNTMKRVRPWVDVQSPLRLQTTEGLQNLQPMSVDKILILCVDFPDKPHQLPVEQIYDRFFSDFGNSLKNYYREVSYSRYIPEGELYGWYRAPQP